MGGLVVRCSIVIPVYGQAALTQQCLDVLLAENYASVDAEIIVVDDCSPDDTPQMLEQYGGRITYLRHETNTGFSTACNDGAAAATGDVLVFLNNDTLPQPGWLDALAGYAHSHPHVDVVGAKLLFPDDTVQHAGVVFDQTGFA